MDSEKKINISLPLTRKLRLNRAKKSVFSVAEYNTLNHNKLAFADKKYACTKNDTFLRFLPQ